MATHKYTVKGKFCSPGSSTSAESCYTKQQLVTIAKAYNKKFNKNLISLTLQKEDLWREIDSRMMSCTNEWCWMDRLNLSDTFNQSGASPFRPVRPKEKNQWLSTIDIRDVLKQYENQYPDFIALGPVPIDFCHLAFNEVCKLNIKQLMSKGKRRIGIVFNTDPSDKPGKHWISMFIDLRGNPETWEIGYFDSFGRAPIAPQILELIEHLKSQNPNFIVKLNCSDKICTSKINHQKKNTECGVYSINFIVERLSGKSWEDMVINNIYDDTLMTSRRNVFFRPSSGNNHGF
jgi:hypothetical protein